MCVLLLPASHHIVVTRIAVRNKKGLLATSERELQYSESALFLEVFSPLSNQDLRTDICEICFPLYRNTNAFDFGWTMKTRNTKTALIFQHS